VLVAAREQEDLADAREDYEGFKAHHDENCVTEIE